MAENTEDRIARVLRDLKAAVERWEASEDRDWELEEEVIFALTIEYIAEEYYPVSNEQLVKDCKAEIEAVKRREEEGEPDWLDFYTIMKKVADGVYGEVLPHLKEMAEIIMGMFYPM